MDCKPAKKRPNLCFQQRLSSAFLACTFLFLSAERVHADPALQNFRLAANSDRAQTFVVGRIARSARKHTNRVSALAEHMAEALSEFGYSKSAIIIAENLEKMIKHMKSGAVDMISETAYGAVELADKAGAVPLAHEWKEGVPFYQSVIVARKDSGFKNLRSLFGKSIAFEDNGSTTAYFVPLALLQKAGLRARHLNSPRTRRLPKSINYLFAHGESNQISLVLNKAVDATAFSNLDWEMITEQNDEIAQAHEIFYTSQQIVRSLVLIRTGMKTAIRDKIMETLERLNQSDSGRRILKKYNNVEQFTPLEEKALTSLKWVRKLRESFQPATP